MYANYFTLYASCLPYFGGYCSSGATAGAFYLRVDISAAVSDVAIGGRLMFL